MFKLPDPPLRSVVDGRRYSGWNAGNDTAPPGDPRGCLGGASGDNHPNAGPVVGYEGGERQSQLHEPLSMLAGLRRCAHGPASS